ncbi:MAG: uracil-DNA glycosylase [Ruminococcus sp.]|nr:uracil-DNA glycosylase [Ruminococcus sp.]
MIQSWDELNAACLACQRCELCKTRTNVVVGVGNPNSEVMFIGEGPGENEDLQGEPFVGKGGILLDKMLCAVDLDRHTNIYIANIVKCRPPHNRDPKPEEQEQCINWLRSQVSLIRPKIIVCLGRIAGCRIIKPDLRITREHGVWFKKGGIWMTAMLHPAAVLRDPRKKPEAFADFLNLREKIKEVCPDTYNM